jgi:hypothetical protein
MPPEELTQEAVTSTAPWIVTASSASEFDIRLQPVNRALALPENSRLWLCISCSAMTQAGPGSSKLATARTVITTRSSMKTDEKLRG